MHSFSFLTTFIFFLCNPYINFLFVFLKDSLRCFFIILFSPHRRVMCKCSSCASAVHVGQRSIHLEDQILPKLLLGIFSFGFCYFFIFQLGGTLHFYVKKPVFSFKPFFFSFSFSLSWDLLVSKG